MLVVPLVWQLKTSEWDIADGGIKKAVREVRFLKPLDSNAAVLIKLLGDTARDGVQFNAVDFGIAQ